MLSIVNALVISVDPENGKECLLRIILKKIDIEYEKKSLLECYAVYDEYVNRIMVRLLESNFLMSNALAYCEMLQQKNELSEELSKKLLYTTEPGKRWTDKWNELLRALLAGFNDNLEWFVLKRSAEAAKSINPFFLADGARQVFWLADAFCSLHLGYGVRGRTFSMGDQFNGELEFGDGTKATGGESTVAIDQKLDYWSATDTAKPGVYDKVVGFPNVWKVHRFYIPGVTAGSKLLKTPLPYTPPAIDVVRIDGQTLQASTKPTDPAFGSFVEVTRAGGAFAFLSGDWEAGKLDNDESNKGGEQHVENVTEYKNANKHPITDNDGMVAQVSQPEIGLVKGGWVPWRMDRRLGGSESLLVGSFRTWWQMAKTISFPNIARSESVALIVSLVPVEGGPACADSLNKYLSGPSGRPQKPKQNITDDEVRRKLGIVGLNYDPSLTFDPSGISRAVPGIIKTGFRVCTVKEGKVGSYDEITTIVSAVPDKKNVYTSDLIDTGASRSVLWTSPAQSE
jgi:hypothetical protein